MAFEDEFRLARLRAEMAAEEALNLRRVFTAAPPRPAPTLVERATRFASGFLRSQAGRVALTPLRFLGLGGVALAAAPLIGQAIFGEEEVPAAQQQLEQTRARRLLEAETRAREAEADLARTRAQAADVELQGIRFGLMEQIQRRVEEEERQRDEEARRRRQALEEEARAIRLAEEQARLRAQEQRREIDFRREQGLLDRALAEQRERTDRFIAVSRTVPAGFMPRISDTGDIDVLPIPAAEPIRPIPAGRLTTVPGVFVGPQFRFKTPEEAISALSGFRIAGQAARERPRR